VADGMGMDKSTIQRIFEPFFTTKGYGRGLGLSATLGIIRLHKGGLLVESQPGQGSTFQILLPASAATAQEAPAQPARSDSAAKNMVLVVDDEPDIREVVAEILQMEGLLVLTAENGRQGVESFQAHQTAIGVIVLDMQMPVMNGAEAAKTMLALDPGIQVILTSGYSEHDLVNGLTKHPSVAFLQKPYTLDRLVATVQMKLQARPLQRSVQIPPC
jgi:CheY-like chemotaxis protein